MILRGGLVAEVGAAFGRVLQGGSLSVAAFWAGAAHPRRQKHREMPPPGASAPAFAATVEPASSPQHAKPPRQDSSSTRDGTRAGGMCCFLHRFVISCPDLRIDARISLFTASFVHRFLISSPNLGIDVSFSPFTPSFVHRFLISGPDLGIDAAPSPLQLGMARLQHSRGAQAGTGCHEGGIILSKKPPEWHLSQPQPRSASDSNFRSGKEEWFRMQQPLPQRRSAYCILKYLQENYPDCRESGFS